MREKACGWNNNLWKATKSATANSGDACLYLDSSAISSHSARLAIFDWSPQKTFQLVNTRSSKNIVGPSGCTWLTTQDSRHIFKFLWPLRVQQILGERQLSNGVIRNLRLVCVIEFGCSIGSCFVELANFIPSEGSVKIPYFVVWLSSVIYVR